MSEIRLTLTLDADAARILTELTSALRASHPTCASCYDTFTRILENLSKPAPEEPAEDPYAPLTAPLSPASAPMPEAGSVPLFTEPLPPEESVFASPAPEAAPEEPARTVTEEDLRDVALRLIRARRREEVAEVVHRYADRISSITDPRDRAACYDALRALEAA